MAPKTSDSSLRYRASRARHAGRRFPSDRAGLHSPEDWRCTPRLQAGVQSCHWLPRFRRITSFRRITKALCRPLLRTLCLDCTASATWEARRSQNTSQMGQRSRERASTATSTRPDISQSSTSTLGAYLGCSRRTRRRSHTWRLTPLDRCLSPPERTGSICTCGSCLTQTPTKTSCSRLVCPGSCTRSFGGLHTPRSETLASAPTRGCLQ
mmetsp:Transcript_13994/g.25258  ORF Transcript_13994/g.25258 Transcript_13994/m.25258 type:complete len:210 (-) Transcript_13994:1649-2278(-)